MLGCLPSGATLKQAPCITHTMCGMLAAGIDRSSPMGLFLRRCVASHGLMSYERTVALFTGLQVCCILCRMRMHLSKGVFF